MTENAPLRIGVLGCAGRMGQTLMRLVADTPGSVLAGGLEQPGHAAVGTDLGVLIGREPRGLAVSDDIESLFDAADAVLDFTAPAASVAYARQAARAGVAHVIGTTGFSPEQDAAIAEAAGRVPIVKSGNMSLGVTLLAELTRRVAAALDDDYDIEIAEMHHRHKVDAPSGTALLLGRAAAAGRGVAFDAMADRGRDGHTGPRERGHLGIAVLRGGDVVGDHSVLFAADGETVELRHRATDRGIFARGAVKAALWTRGRPPGLYGMTDVLGFDKE
jgi:4-hydroxy-tetrahydrodipicolinate reductase